MVSKDHCTNTRNLIDISYEDIYLKSYINFGIGISLVCLGVIFLFLVKSGRWNREVPQVAGSTPG